MGQDDVSRVIPSYPLAIKTVEENNGQVAWVDPTEKARIEKIHVKLKTNYVFVIWSKRMMKNTYCSNQEGCTNTYSADVYGNMLEYPGGRIVSHTAFSRRNSDSVLSLFRSKGYYVDEVGKASQFQVLSQKHVAQAIPHYPQLVKGPYKSAYFEIDEDYNKTDLARVKEIQKHLGVDYLYILWAPASVQSGGKGLFFKNYPVMHVIVQVFEYPGGREIGRGKYMIRVDDDRNELLRDDLARVAKEFVEKTRLPK